jgi:ribonuclease P protein component
VRQDGRRIGDAFFSLQYLVNSVGRPRLGMAVSMRTAGSAITRNRVRRVVRESFRLRQHELPACDLFVTARGAAREASNAVMFASLERLWRRVAP